MTIISPRAVTRAAVAATATLMIDGRKPHDVLACPSGRGEWTFRRS